MRTAFQRPQRRILTLRGENLDESISELIVATGCQVLAELIELNKKGWEDPGLDAQFEKWRNISALKSTPETAISWLRTYCTSMREMNRQLKFIPDGPTSFLDLGCAPGGYSKCVLETNPRAVGTGICLSKKDGGHLFMLAKHFRTRYTVHFADMTKYDLRDGESTRRGRALPFTPASFDMVIADGHALHTREFGTKDPHILIICQIIIALKAVKDGGVIFIKLAKLTSFATASILYLFDSISSSLETIKPRTVHGNRRTFYAVEMQLTMEDIASDSDEDLDGSILPIYEQIITPAQLKEEYIPRLVELGTPVWRVQKEALADLIGKKGRSKVGSEEEEVPQEED
ncbi:hypothetical protein FS837_012450 [Tulasnella sp. UAMH 9824]|nr:hypothetical protein FS837_012450 [Tulasnella sp. UAMH 9824]